MVHRFGSRYKWFLLALLWISFINVHFHRVAYSPLIPTIMQELNISYTLAGLLMSAYFFTYASLQIPVGYLADKLGARTVTSLSLLILAIGVLLFSKVTSLETGVIARSIIGLGAAALWVSGLKVLSLWFKPAERGLITGIYGASGTTGAIIALLGVPLLSAIFGWRYMFFLSALPLVFLAVIDWFTIKDRPMDVGLSPVNEFRLGEFEVSVSPSLKSPIYMVFSNRYMWALCIGQFLYCGGMYGALTWVPTYGFKELGFSMTWAGFIGSLIAFGALGAPLAGFLSDKLGRKPVFVTGMICFGVFMFLFMLLSPTYGSAIFVLLALLAGISTSSLLMSFPIVTELFPPSVIGLAFGLLNMFAFLGALVYPILMGAILDLSGSYFLAFVSIVVGELAGAVIVFFVKKT